MKGFRRVGACEEALALGLGRGGEKQACSRILSTTSEGSLARMLSEATLMLVVWSRSPALLRFCVSAVRSSDASRERFAFAIAEKIGVC